MVVIRNLKNTDSNNNEHINTESAFESPDEDDYGTHYGEYAGTYAQDVMGYSDDVIMMPLMVNLMLIGILINKNANTT